MRHITWTPFLLISIIICSISTAWSIPTFSLRKRIPPVLSDLPPVRHTGDPQQRSSLSSWLQLQEPGMGNAHPKIVMPPSGNSGKGAKDPKDANQNNPIISDVLPKTRAINIFARLTRDFESVESRLSDPSKNLTVLAPRNGAIMDLPRKPWENPDDYAQFGEANAYEGEEGQDRAKRNLKRFVEAHIVTVSPWEEGDEAETLAGDKLRWTKDGDKIYIQPGNVEVESIAEQVSNGEVWILNGVINYR
ncbi:FAS1 domain-containing protein [Aspergillus steynii IBT 23096]|uniref:FAS1 domain-containing protein n=1 Tax=Aspergillus steynii IBT 23096 TaxID=1392250 RepID=A0A2I2GCW6_9EURO|nr:FAS1 domain-containing protein [Aspergillus steynii IBT 23096]PLB50721.1 FAS1 domain-containing protein [Aspergillus steynii IBT 23096]